MASSSVMVIGGGISGIEASLTLAEQGYKVILVEKTSSKLFLRWIVRYVY